MSEEQIAAIDAKYQQLFERRSAKQPPPEGLATAADLAELKLATTRPLHSTATSGGILTLALAPGGALVATGALRLC